MIFDQMTEGMMKVETEFSQMESLEEILESIKEKTLDKMETETTFMKEFPNPIYAVMRLDYLMESNENESSEDVNRSLQGEQIGDHLMETQKRAISFMREENRK